MNDHKGLAVAPVVKLVAKLALIALCVLVGNKFLNPAKPADKARPAYSQKHAAVEDRVAELAYPIYVSLETRKEVKGYQVVALKNYIESYYASHPDPKEFGEIQAAIERGQKRAQNKVRRDYDIRLCPLSRN